MIHLIYAIIFHLLSCRSRSDPANIVLLISTISNDFPELLLKGLLIPDRLSSSSLSYLTAWHSTIRSQGDRGRWDLSQDRPLTPFSTLGTFTTIIHNSVMVLKTLTIVLFMVRKGYPFFWIPFRVRENYNFWILFKVRKTSTFWMLFKVRKKKYLLAENL